MQHDWSVWQQLGFKIMHSSIRRHTVLHEHQELREEAHPPRIRARVDPHLQPQAPCSEIDPYNDKQWQLACVLAIVVVSKGTAAKSIEYAVTTSPIAKLDWTFWPSFRAVSSCPSCSTVCKRPSPFASKERPPEITPSKISHKTLPPKSCTSSGCG